MARHIHPTAIVDPLAEIGENVTIGPYCVIGANVTLGPDNELANHVSIQGKTTIGRGNRFFPYGSIGQDPQDKKYHGEPLSFLEIGDGNTVREFVTINRGSKAGGGYTRVGDENWIMAYCHIAHDCHIGDKTIFANGTTLAGHVTVGDMATLGGMTAIHQFCAIGPLAITGGLTKVTLDVPPYVTADGNPVKPHGINKIGLERAQFTPEEAANVDKAYRIFYRSHLMAKEALARLDSELSGSPAVRAFAEFIRKSQRGVCR